ncbi:toll-interacting protein [Limosa lapponica baueri]|uniref:Toll-interacting protein n=1 Tax=Limosa lapponica baueri TaxID=1758121 RepID=A0A2I0TKZ8_LIMLA|nr:toll-interacting protein [Limosa lapponica baueri]
MKRDFRALGRLVKGSGAQVVFSSIPPVAGIDEGINRKSQQMNSWLRDWCNQQDFGFFDHGLICRTPGMLATGLKRDGDETGFSKVEPGSSMSVLAGKSASKVLQSVVSVEVGDADPCGSKDMRSSDRLVTTEGSQLFRRDRQGRRGGGVALYVRDNFEFLEHNNVNDSVECVWVRIKEKARKADTIMGVCYRPPNQDVEADEIFYKQLAEVSRSLALVLVGDFNFPDVCWKYNTAEREQSQRFLECVEDNFLTQLVREPTRESTLLDLLLVNREGLVEDVKPESTQNKSHAQGGFDQMLCLNKILENKCTI